MFEVSVSVVKSAANRCLFVVDCRSSSAGACVNELGIWHAEGISVERLRHFHSLPPHFIKAPFLCLGILPIVLCFVF